MLKPLERFRGCLLGLAVGDAVGNTLEFISRGTFAPLTDMVGGAVRAQAGGVDRRHLNGAVPGDQPGRKGRL